MPCRVVSINIQNRTCCLAYRTADTETPSHTHLRSVSLCYRKNSASQSCLLLPSLLMHSNVSASIVLLLKSIMFSHLLFYHYSLNVIQQSVIPYKGLRIGTIPTMCFRLRPIYVYEKRH